MPCETTTVTTSGGGGNGGGDPTTGGFSPITLLAGAALVAFIADRYLN